MKTMLGMRIAAATVGLLFGAAPVQAFTNDDLLQSLQGTWMQAHGKCSEPDYIWTRLAEGRFRYVCIPSSLGSCDYDDVPVSIRPEGKSFYIQYPPGQDGKEVWERFRFHGPDHVEFYESSQGYTYSIQRCSASTAMPGGTSPGTSPGSKDYGTEPTRPNGPIDGGPKPPAEKSNSTQNIDRFFGHDDRTFPDSASYPWDAIGKLTFVGGGYCTAQLIAPRVILTAAHCMFEGETSSDPSQPDQFLAGFDRGRSVGSARIVGWEIAKGYDHKRHITTSEIDGLDYAFLVLDRDLGSRIGTFDIRAVSEGDLERLEGGHWLTMSLAGYSSDHEDQLTAHVGCRIVEIYDDNTVFHECDTLEGASGSALFVKEDGRYRIVGIESAFYPNDKGPYEHNMAVDSRAFYAAARNFIDAHS